MPDTPRRRARSDFQVRYEAFVDGLRREILSGLRRPGDLLPPEHELADSYRLSLGSVRKALKQLVDEGLVMKSHGRGTVVSYRGARGDNVLRFAIYSPNTDLPALQELITAFRREHPEVEVKIIRLFRPTFTKTLADLIQSGNPPDLVFGANYQLQEISEVMELLDLQDVLGDDIGTWRLYPQVDASFRVGNRLLAAPLIFSPIVLAYNQRLFDQADLPYPDSTWTWHTLAEAARALTRTDGEGRTEQYGFGLSLGPNRWSTFLLQNGASLAPEPPPENETRVLEVVEFAHRLMFRDRVSPLGDPSSGVVPETVFASGRIAMVLTSYQWLNDYGKIPFPMDITVTPKGRTRATLLIGAGIAVNAASGRKADALSFLRFCVRQDSQRVFRRMGCSIPASRDVCDDSSDLSPEMHPPSYHIYQQAMAYSYPFAKLGGWPEYHALTDGLTMVWNNLMSPEEGTHHALARVRALHRGESDQRDWGDGVRMDKRSAG